MATAARLYICASCGQPTEWDQDLGTEPLCLNCWDKQTDSWNPIAALQRRYYQEHKAEIAARKRREGLIHAS